MHSSEGHTQPQVSCTCRLHSPKTGIGYNSKKSENLPSVKHRQHLSYYQNSQNIILNTSVEKTPSLDHSNNVTNPNVVLTVS